MKKIFYSGIAIIAMLVSCEKDNDPAGNNNVDITMGSNHVNDVYYDFNSGELNSYSRAEWDLSFSVPLQTAAIRINEGAGVLLYSWGDSTAWNSVDTAGIGLRTPVFNDKSDWMNGAFNRYAQGGFNFGWGTYDHGGSYSVWGDSIYVIRLTNGDYRKLFIRKRLGYSDAYELRWSNIDGSDETNASFSPSPYAGKKHFIQYSIVNSQVVEAEPDMENWDAVFTQYLVKLPAGQGVFLDYPVVGMLLRPGAAAVKVEGPDPETAHYNDAGTDFSEAADVIGWDWKISDPVTREISLATNTSYFIKVADNDIYRIYFTAYESRNNGLISFRTDKVE